MRAQLHLTMVAVIWGYISGQSFTSSNYWGGRYVINVESSYNNSLDSKPLNRRTRSLDMVAPLIPPLQCRLSACHSTYDKSNSAVVACERFLLNYATSTSIEPNRMLKYAGNADSCQYQEASIRIHLHEITA